MKGRDTAASKGAAPGGRLTRRDAHCKNDEDAGRNSHGHRTRSASTGRTLFRLIRQLQGASWFCAAPGFSLIFAPREGCDAAGLSDERRAFSVPLWRKRNTRVEIQSP
jgi:hypothetical protein